MSKYVIPRSYKIGDYEMRAFEEEKLRMVLEWRNSDRIHKEMLTSHLITWEEHYSWYLRHKDDEPIQHFIFYYKNIPIGYIGYNELVLGEKCNPGAYLGELEVAPVNAGFALNYLLTDYAFRYYDINRLNTYVIKGNNKSVGIAKLLGYKYIEGKDEVINGKESSYYCLYKEVWFSNKDRLRHFVD